MKHLRRLVIGIGLFALSLSLFIGTIWVCKEIDSFIPDLPDVWEIWISVSVIVPWLVWQAYQTGKEFMEDFFP